jgi:hypothetical protein
LDELTDILRSVLERPNPLRFGLTGDAIKANPPLAGHARRVMNQPDRAAKLAGVEVILFERSNPQNERAFPDELIDRFRLAARWHDQHKTEQRKETLCLSLSSCADGAENTAQDVLETPYVLVARNSTFTKLSKLFVADQIGVPEFAFGPAIEIKTLAAILWMRFGSEVDTDLPQVQLISACDRILATNGSS